MAWMEVRARDKYIHRAHRWYWCEAVRRANGEEYIALMEMQRGWRQEGIK